MSCLKLRSFPLIRVADFVTRLLYCTGFGLLILAKKREMEQDRKGTGIGGEYDQFGNAPVERFGSLVGALSTQCKYGWRAPGSRKETYFS
jgi:hypothetical protein